MPQQPAQKSLTANRYVFRQIGRLDDVEQMYMASSNAFTTGFAYAVNTSLNTSTRTITYPSGRVVTETSDLRGQLETMTLGFGLADAKWFYDAANRRTGSLQGPVDSSFGYDVNSRLTDLRHGDQHGGDLYKVTYGYDAVGNRLYTQDHLKVDFSEQYTYDNRHRLETFRRGTLDGSFDIPNAAVLANSVLTGKRNWTLDSRGNWDASSREVDDVTSSESRTRNGANEILSIDPDAGGPFAAELVEADKNGNLTIDPIAPNAGGNVPAGQR